MQQYESDYDEFVSKLHSKKTKTKHEANAADKNHAQATAHKMTHLGQKAKGLIDQAGGIEGSKNTIQNVMKYFNTNPPSDYQVGLGEDKAKMPAEKTILGLPPIAVYVGGAVLGLAVLYGLSQLIQHKPASDSASAQHGLESSSQSASHHEPILQ